MIEDLTAAVAYFAKNKDAFTVVLGILGLVGILFSWRSSNAAKRSSDAALEQARIANDGKITDRLAKAVEQLGSEKLQVRLGAIYALERVALDSPRDHGTVFEHLADFVREHSKIKHKPGVAFIDEDRSPAKDDSGRRDVSLILKVIGRRNRKNDKNLLIDLSNCDLKKLRLSRGDYSFVNFFGSDLSGTTFHECKVQYVNFIKAKLHNVSFIGADLYQTNFHNADLQEVDFSQGIMARCRFIKARIIDCNFLNTDLTGCTLLAEELRDNKFRGSKFSHSEISGFDFALNILEMVRMDHASLKDCNAREAELHDIDLSDSVITKGNWEGAKLQRMQAQRAKFMEVNLNKAKMSNSKLSNTTFKKCKMYQANLTAAHKDNTIFDNSDSEHHVNKYKVK